MLDPVASDTERLNRGCDVPVIDLRRANLLRVLTCASLRGGPSFVTLEDFYSPQHAQGIDATARSSSSCSDVDLASSLVNDDFFDWYLKSYDLRHDAASELRANAPALAC